MKDRDSNHLQQEYDRMLALQRKYEMVQNLEPEKEITPKVAMKIISAIWGDGRNITRKVFEDLDPVLPHKELPILDRLLSVAGLLDEYNQRERPAFKAFRNWWYSKESALNNQSIAQG